MCSSIGFDVAAGMVIRCDLVQFGYNKLFNIFFGTVKELTTSDELRSIYSLFDNDSFLYAGFNSNTFLILSESFKCASNPPWEWPASSNKYPLYFYKAHYTLDSLKLK